MILILAKDDNAIAFSDPPQLLCQLQVDVYGVAMIMFELFDGTCPYGQLHPVQAAYFAATEGLRPEWTKNSKRCAPPPPPPPHFDLFDSARPYGQLNMVQVAYFAATKGLRPEWTKNSMRRDSLTPPPPLTPRGSPNFQDCMQYRSSLQLWSRRRQMCLPVDSKPPQAPHFTSVQYVLQVAEVPAWPAPPPPPFSSLPEALHLILPSTSIVCINLLLTSYAFGNETLTLELHQVAIWLMTPRSVIHL